MDCFPEDTIVNKLVFAREQDIKDALGIFVRQYDSLDKEYLEENAKKIGVYDELRELRKKYAKGIDQCQSRL